jgi:hypothetical protein
MNRGWPRTTTFLQNARAALKAIATTSRNKTSGDLEVLLCISASGLIANLLIIPGLLPRTAADLLFVLLVSVACRAAGILLK